MQLLTEARELLIEHPIFTLGVLLFVGYLVSRLAVKLHLPGISGYIIAGLLMNHTTTGLFPPDLYHSYSMITEVALGLVALTIGAEFSAAKLRRIGRHIVVIVLVQSVLVFALVAGMLTVFGLALPFALLLGVIAVGTEPTATVAEVQALGARGRFVDYLFSIVALDDAFCVVFFSFVFAFVSRMLIGGALDNSLVFSQILWALKEIFLSLFVGAIAGFILYRMIRGKQGRNEILIITLGILLINTALALAFNFSPLLTNLMAGAVLINISSRNYQILRILEPLTPPVYALFFVLAGTELDYRLVMQPGIVVLGAVYILFRAAGKYSGNYLGCRISGVRSPYRENLGWCMLPHGGVALGLILLIQTSPILSQVEMPQFETMLSSMLNIVLLCVFFSELTGPPLTKMGLLRGCEIEDT